jgi:hypothetical protein
MVARIAAGHSASARLLVRGLHQSVADDATLGAFAVAKTSDVLVTRRSSTTMPRLTRDTGVSGDFGVPPGRLLQ